MTPEEKRRSKIRMTKGGKNRPTKEHMKVVIKEKVHLVACMIGTLGICFMICSFVDWSLDEMFLKIPKNESITSENSVDNYDVSSDPEFIEAQKKYDEEQKRKFPRSEADFKIFTDSFPESSEDSETESDEDSSDTEESIKTIPNSTESTLEIVQVNDVADSTENISISEYEMDLMVRAVQHEVGANPSYFEGCDFDTVQCQMASVIWNRVQSSNFPNTVEGVLNQPGQFMPLEELASIEIDDRTYQNVLKVVNGEFNSNSLYERSSSNTPIMETQVEFSAITADGRYVAFLD